MWLEDMFNLYIQQRDTETSHQLNIASKFRSTDAERFYKTLVTRYHRSFMNIKNNLTRQQEILLNQVRSEETFLFGKLTRLGHLRAPGVRRVISITPKCFACLSNHLAWAYILYQALSNLSAVDNKPRNYI